MSSPSLMRTSPPLASPCSSSSPLPLRRRPILLRSPAADLGSRRGPGESFRVVPPARGPAGLRQKIPRVALDGSPVLDPSPSYSRSSFEEVAALKLKLLNAVSGLNRGLAAGEEDLRKADEAAKELEAAGGAVDLACDLDKLQGRWKLVYSSAFSSRTLGGSRPGPPVGRLLPITLGQVFQRIDVVSKDFDNIVELQFGTPWPLPPAEATATLAHKFEVIGQSSTPAPLFDDLIQDKIGPSSEQGIYLSDSYLETIRSVRLLILNPSVKCAIDLADPSLQCVDTDLNLLSSIEKLVAGVAAHLLPQISTAPLIRFAIRSSLPCSSSILENIIEEQHPAMPRRRSRALDIQKASLVEEESEILTQMRACLAGSAKIRITFEKTTVKATGNLSQLPPLELPRLPDSLRPPSNTGSGEFEVTYADEDLRITRGDREELRVFVVS